MCDNTDEYSDDEQRFQIEEHWQQSDNLANWILHTTSYGDMVDVELEWNGRAADSREDFIILFVDNCNERVICESICEQRTFATKYHFDYSVDLRCEHQYRFCCPKSYLVVDGVVQRPPRWCILRIFPISCNRTYGTCVTCAYAWNFSAQNIWSHTHVPWDDSLMDGEGAKRDRERQTRLSNVIIDRMADSVPFNTIYTYFAKCELIDLEWMIHTNDDGMEPSRTADENDGERAHRKKSESIESFRHCNEFVCAIFLCRFCRSLVVVRVLDDHHRSIGPDVMYRAYIFALPIFRLVPSIHPSMRRISVTMPFLATNDFITIAEMRTWKMQRTMQNCMGKIFFVQIKRTK